jgi:hypothetical protein
MSSIKYTTTFTLMIVATTAALLMLVVLVATVMSGNIQESSATRWHPASANAAAEVRGATSLQSSFDRHYYSLSIKDEKVVVSSAAEPAPGVVLVVDETVTTSSSFRQQQRSLFSDFSGDRSIQSLKQKFQVAKAELESQLKVDYGEEAYSMLFQTADKKTRLAYKSPSDDKDAGVTGPSWDRMVRRLVKKIVKSQLENRNLPFIWSTGGHSGEMIICLLLLLLLIDPFFCDLTRKMTPHALLTLFSLLLHHQQQQPRRVTETCMKNRIRPFLVGMH